MNNTTIYQHLQKHYHKLTARLAKAKARNRSVSFQQQLLGRLERCSLQLKHLGAGAAVVAALGVATPAMAQLPQFTFTERTGASNPFDTIPVPPQEGHLIFSDIDGDGINDMTAMGVFNFGGYQYEYYDNAGTNANPSYAKIFGPSGIYAGIGGSTAPAFVDLDGDGDEDFFTSSRECYNVL